MKIYPYLFQADKVGFILAGVGVLSCKKKKQDKGSFLPVLAV